MWPSYPCGPPTSQATARHMKEATLDQSAPTQSPAGHRHVSEARTVRSNHELKKWLLS